MTKCLQESRMREPERAEIEHPEGGPARGERSESNPQVRFDEGEQRAWRKPPVALYSTGLISISRFKAG